MRRLVPTIRKALTAAGFALIGALGTAMIDGDLTQEEVIIAGGAALLAGAATYRVPNARQYPREPVE